MKYICLSFLLLSACHFHPLFENQTTEHVCVAPISEATGYQLQQALKQHFPNSSDCLYTLVVQTPKFSLSDQSISDKDFITMQRIQASSNYKLLNIKKETLLSNTAFTSGSSAVISNPYSTVVSIEKTEKDLVPLLANQIALHIAAYLDREQQ